MLLLWKDTLLPFRCFIISFLQIIRKNQKQNSAENEDEESDSVVGADVLKNGKDSAGGVKKPEDRNTTYEVLPKNSENACKYLIILSLEKKLGCF